MVDNGHSVHDVAKVRCAIITVSDTRTEANDASGKLIRDALGSADHVITSYEILPDEPDRLRDRVGGLCVDVGVDAVMLTGGTGLARRDTTYEAIVSLLDKQLDGFGELFRMLSFEEVGAAAMLSRAVAGVCQNTAVFSLPGSQGAVRLAMERLIVPQLSHIVALLRG